MIIILRRTLQFYETNILMGVVSLIVAIDLKKILDGKLEALSKRDYILMLMGTAGVTLRWICASWI